MLIILYGKNPVLSGIESKRVKKVYLIKNFSDQKVLNIIKNNNIEFTFIDGEKMEKLSGTNKHQGIIAEAEEYKTLSLDEFLNKVKGKEKSLVVILDELQDPHNLGAVLRVCDAFKVDGIIFKKHNQVKITSTVVKISTGAINYVSCVEVSNLTNAVKLLKKNSYWIYGTDMKGKQNYMKTDYPDKVAFVIGSEGFGISKLVKENCDVIIEIPMGGHVNSLNASNACAIVVSDAYNKIYDDK